MSKYTYQQWSQRLPKEIFSGTLAVFEMDGFLAAYAPSTGFRSLKRLPLGVRSPPSTESISVMVQIQDSYALFKVTIIRQKKKNFFFFIFFNKIKRCRPKQPLMPCQLT